MINRRGMVVVAMWSVVVIAAAYGSADPPLCEPPSVKTGVRMFFGYCR